MGWVRRNGHGYGDYMILLYCIICPFCKKIFLLYYNKHIERDILLNFYKLNTYSAQIKKFLKKRVKAR